MLFYLLVFRHDIASCHLSASACGLVQSCEDVHGCSFAGSVCPKESEDFAFLDGKGYVIYCMEGAKGFHETRDFDGVVLFIIHPLFFTLLLGFFALHSLYSWRIEDIPEAFQNFIGFSDTFYFPLLQENNAVATAHLIEIRCGDNDGYSLLFQGGKYLPELLSSYRIYACGWFIE